MPSSLNPATGEPEETFGPVASVTRVSGATKAIEPANRTEYGVGAARWTSDLDQARRLVPLIDAGAIFVNGMAPRDSAARPPFRRWRELIGDKIAGLPEVTHLRHVLTAF